MQGQRRDLNSPLPRYYQIYSALLSMIEGGEVTAGEALPPERQIADDFGVSRPTVVKALDLLEREGRIVKQQGRGNLILEAKQPNKARQTIAFVASPHMPHDLVMGISQRAFEHHYHLQILGIDQNFGQLEHYLESCLAGDVAGFIVYGRAHAQDAKVYQKLLARGVPVVMADRYYDGLECDQVVYDNEAAGFALTQKLLARGHRRIAVLPGYEADVSAVKDRILGYQCALEQVGISPDDDLIWLDLYHQFIPEQHVQVPYREVLREKLEQFKPTAILSINDLIANYALHDLMHLHESSHDDTFARVEVELASFSSHSLAQHPSVKVFAVHPTLKLGRAAATLLIERLKEPQRPTRQQIMTMNILASPMPTYPNHVSSQHTSPLENERNVLFQTRRKEAQKA